MIKNTIVVIGLISLNLISSGCMRNKLVLVSDENRNAAIENLNRTAKRRDAADGIIVMQNGDTIPVKNITVRGDSVFWRTKQDDSTVRTAFSEIRTVSITKGNMAKGSGLGLLLGVGIGSSIVVVSILKDPQRFESRSARSMTAAVLIFGIPYGFLGMVHGGITKTTDIYHFNDKAQEDFQLVPGQRVRVTASKFLQKVNEVRIVRANEARKSRYTGSLITLKADTLVMKADSWQESFVIPLTTLKKLEVGRGRGKSRILASASYGFFGGAIAGSILGGTEVLFGDCAEYEDLCAYAGAIYGGVLFGLVGAAVGDLGSREMWQEVPLQNFK